MELQGRELLEDEDMIRLDDEIEGSQVKAKTLTKEERNVILQDIGD